MEVGKKRRIIVSIRRRKFHLRNRKVYLIRSNKPTIPLSANMPRREMMLPESPAPLEVDLVAYKSLLVSRYFPP